MSKKCTSLALDHRVRQSGVRKSKILKGSAMGKELNRYTKSVCVFESFNLPYMQTSNFRALPVIKVQYNRHAFRFEKSSENFEKLKHTRLIMSMQ